MSVVERQKCSLCKTLGTMDDVLELPSTPLANEFVAKPTSQILYPLVLVLCRHCNHVQLKHIVDQKTLYNNYVYKTGTSSATRQRLGNLASDLVGRLKLGPESKVMEIGCNDCTFLKAFEALGVTKLRGIDPSGSPGEGSSIGVRKTAFNSAVAEEEVSANGLFDLVIADNVFAHVEDVRDMLEGAKAVLKPGGHLTMEVSYLQDLLIYGAFDTIYHEHASYHSLGPLCQVFQSMGMSIAEARWDRSQIGRGSLRLLVSRKPLGGHSYPSSVARLIEMENLALRSENGGPFGRMRKRIDLLDFSLNKVVEGLRKAGFIIRGYGAPAKMTTLMYSASFPKGIIECIVDDAVDKQGLLTPGYNIPVVSPARVDIAHEVNVAYVLFGWNFARQILEKFKDSRCAWIVPLPDLRFGTAREILAAVGSSNEG